MSARANALADRVLAGANALAEYATSLSDTQWRTKITPDGRTAGVIVHHVASMYPVEVELAGVLAKSQAVAGVTWAAVAEINAKHAHEHTHAAQAESIALLHRNSAAAADLVRKFTDAELDAAAPLSLNENAPLTAQFMIEAHAVAHSFHHLAKLRAALG
jgi:hypothetical protein